MLIGIADLQPPQTLSLLFQMAEGTADPDAEREAVVWSVLDVLGWRRLPDAAILRDGTRGLISSGIVELALPAATPDTRLPLGFYWLRASVKLGTAAVCDTVAIYAQAVAARRVLDRPAMQDLTPLPAHTIKTLATTVAGVAAIRQPYPSFGGRPRETDEDFYLRSSERLRHRQRAVAASDYERLVLQRFPEIYKAKCLPASLPGTEAGIPDADALGLVRLIVIPDSRNKHSFDPLRPKASPALLANIADYLAPLLPGTARLQVVNPNYVPVRIRAAVRFRDQNNQDVYAERLNAELVRFLSPWAYDQGADIVIGRRLYASSIVTFIDGRPYVDYVARIELFSSEDGTTFAQQIHADGDYIAADRPGAILVSVLRHDIDQPDRTRLHPENRFLVVG